MEKMRENIKQFILYGKTLDLNGFGIENFPQMIKNKKEILQLDIGNNQFHSLPLNEEIPNIEILKCHTNGLYEIPIYSNLRELYCMRNNLSSLPVLPLVEKIHCQDNFIQHVPTMPKLKELRILDNPVLQIDFQPKLEILYMSKNRINQLPLLPRLKKLIIINFHKFMDYHCLEDTACSLRLEVVKQKIKYLKYYIHIVKMQRRYRRNKSRKLLEKYIKPQDLIKKIIEYITL